MVREAIGGAFNGSSARAASNRNSHGRESIRSITRTVHLSQNPPKYPAMPPTITASPVRSEWQQRARRQQQEQPWQGEHQVDHPYRALVPESAEISGDAAHHHR